MTTKHQPMSIPLSREIVYQAVVLAVVVLLSLACFAVDASPQDTKSLGDAFERRPAAAEKATADVTPLKPAKTTAENGKKTEMKLEPSPSPLGWIICLLFVVGLFLVAAWMIRRSSPRMCALLPPEAFELLGHAPLANRQQTQLVRFGNKLLLIATNVGSAETLAELTDPAEVERLTDLCRKSRDSAAAAAIGRLFRKKEPSDG